MRLGFLCFCLLLRCGWKSWKRYYCDVGAKTTPFPLLCACLPSLMLPSAVCLWVKHWHSISDRTYLTTSLFDGRRRHQEAFGIDYPHFVTDTPHTHRFLVCQIKTRGQVRTILHCYYHHPGHIYSQFPWITAPPAMWLWDIPIRTVSAVVCCTLYNPLYTISYYPLNGLFCLEMSHA